jgi:hypothetical protein
MKAFASAISAARVVKGAAKAFNSLESQQPFGDYRLFFLCDDRKSVFGRELVSGAL